MGQMASLSVVDIRPKPSVQRPILLAGHFSCAALTPLFLVSKPRALGVGDAHYDLSRNAVHTGYFILAGI